MSPFLQDPTAAAQDALAPTVVADMRAEQMRFQLLSVVIPTYNESQNVAVLIAAIERVMGQVIPFEIVVVDDDSPDRTWELVEKLALTRRGHDLRVVRRIHKRGLSSAIFDGFSCARGDALMVIDADLQHDETIIPRMLEALSDHSIVIGSRYAAGGGTDRWSKRRHLLSATATKLSRLVLGVRVKDPMSGFFMLRRGIFDACSAHVNQRGFKLLLEIIHSSRRRDIAEVPYVFKARKFGESKLDARVGFDFLVSVYDLKFGRVLSRRFVKYALVGLSGVAVNLAVLNLAVTVFALPNRTALLSAILVAMVSNFFLNNRFTFPDSEDRGRLFAAFRMAVFISICAVGCFINYSVATFLSEHHQVPILYADLIGIAIGTVWNYFGSSTCVWRVGNV
jgi:dolichol-phosphate mannosyltransferase